MYTIVSPILKKPLVCGTYMENTIVDTHTSDVKIAKIANRIAEGNSLSLLEPIKLPYEKALLPYLF